MLMKNKRIIIPNINLKKFYKISAFQDVSHNSINLKEKSFNRYLKFRNHLFNGIVKAESYSIFIDKLRKSILSKIISKEDCFNCNEDLKRDSILLSKIRFDFQDKYMEIFNTGIYNSEKIGSIHFFRQLWKIATVESKDPKIKRIEFNSEFVSTERIFKALLISYKCLNNDTERLKKPFLCLKDGKKFSNKFELDLHNKKNYALESIDDEEIRRKFEVIEPLLQTGKLSHNIIDKRGKLFGVNRYTIYRWIRAFKQNGIDGLALKKREKGKRSKRFTNEVYQIMEDNINTYDAQSLSMKDCWKKIKDACIALGYKNSQIPSYETIRKRIINFELK